VPRERRVHDAGAVVVAAGERLVVGGSSTVSGSGSGSGSIRGTVSGSGTSGPSASSGEIRRGDGIVIRYRCGGNEVVEFAIERP